MIGVIIGLLSEAPEGRTLTIDTWLMSCRVLGRKVEEAMLSEIVRSARLADVQRIVGIYIPSEKNHMVADHYIKLGFAALDKLPDGTCLYCLEIAGYQPQDLPHKVSRPQGLKDGTLKDGGLQVAVLA
jgi:predicted enzyme involved in methoxymalonyl-ACP biosynthesis